MIAVVDTGPLVYLAQLGRLHLLRDLYSPCIPSAVQSEIAVWTLDAHRLIDEDIEDWLQVISLEDVAMRDYLLPEIDLGEAEVIALAKQLGTPRVIMDDQDARRHARLRELEPLGTLGVLLQAKQRGLLPAIRPEINRLAETNFYFSPSLIEAVLQAANETL